MHAAKPLNIWWADLERDQVVLEWESKSQISGPQSPARAQSLREGSGEVREAYAVTRVRESRIPRLRLQKE